MHTEYCADSDFRDWWPQGRPADVDVSTLPSAGSTSNPTRLPIDLAIGDSGDDVAPWVGVWGPFVGLRIGYSPRESFPISSGAAFVYPRGKKGSGSTYDLFLSKDSGGAGTMSMARFKTQAAALAWGKSNSDTLRAAGGGAFGPFPAASALSDADPNPTTTRVGANVLVWNGANWERWPHQAWAADNAPVPSITPAVNAYSTIYSDRTTTSFPLRQPDALTSRTVQTRSSAINAALGVKATRTAVHDGRLVGASCAMSSGSIASTGTAIYAIQWTPSGGNPSYIAVATVPTGAGPGNAFAFTALGGYGMTYGAGDKIEIALVQAGTNAAAVDLGLFFLEERAAF